MAQSLVTYAELGERLGCSPDAARKWAGHRHLRRIRGNDGKARVEIDLAEIGDRPEKRRTAKPETARKSRPCRRLSPPCKRKSSV